MERRLKKEGKADTAKRRQKGGGEEERKKAKGKNCFNGK